MGWFDWVRGSRGAAKKTPEAANSALNGPNRTKRDTRALDGRLDKERIARSIDANWNTRDWRWRGRPNHVGIAYRMMTDDTVQNAASIRINPLVSHQAIWRVEPPIAASEYEIEAAQFAEWMVTQCINWRKLLKFVGWNWHIIGNANVEFSETVAPVSRDAFPSHPTPDRATVLDKFVGIPPWSIYEYTAGEADEAKDLIQYSTDGGYRTLNMKRDLVLRFANRQEGRNFYGVPTARAAYGKWRQKTIIEVLRLQKHERYASPVPYAKEPQRASNADRELVSQYLEEFRAHSNGFFTLPFEWEVDLLAPHIEHGTEVTPDIQSLKLGIYEAFTNGVAAMGSEKFGSHALARTQDNHLDNAIEGDATDISGVINHGSDGWGLIPRITAMNYPGARPGHLQGSNFSQAANAAYVAQIKELYAVGAIRPFAEMEDFLLDKLVAPKPSVPWDERAEVVRRQEITSVQDEENAEGESAQEATE